MFAHLDPPSTEGLSLCLLIIYYITTLNKNPEGELKKITFDNHVDKNEVQDLNIDNKDILHLYDGGDLSCNIGVQH